MARWIESWMPGSTGSTRGDDVGVPVRPWPGARFGLPTDGVGSVAGFFRRLVALTIDWFLGYLIAALFLGPEVVTAQFAVLGMWFLITVVPVALFGASAGMTVVGIRVASIDSAAVIGVPRAVLRTALIAVVVPPLVRDGDGRGWHDRATRTIVVRTRA